MKASIELVTNSPVHLLHRAGQLAEDNFARLIGDTGITARQVAVLSAVAELEKPSQTALCQITGIDRSTLADIVRRLVSRGLLVRRRTREDARMYAVRITPEGEKILATALPILERASDTLLKRLTATERATFYRLLEKVVSLEAEV
jgi:DNA-binding MarR family transcriptional regulator